MPHWRMASLLLVTCLLLTACSLLPASPPKVEGAWARPGGSTQGTSAPMGTMAKPGMTPTGGMAAMKPEMMNTSAVYLTIVGGSAPDALVRASVDPAIVETVEIHETTVVNSVAQMQQVTKIDVGAGARVELKPGGYHIMLINLKRELKAGDRISVMLGFEKAGEISVDAEVRTP